VHIKSLRAVLTVLGIEFCHTGPISLCVDLFVFIYVYFVCFFAFTAFGVLRVVSTVGWAWRYWSLTLWSSDLSSFSALTLLVELFDP